MKKIITLLTIAAFALVAVSCGKDDGIPHDGGYTSLSGTIQNMPTSASKYTLKAFIDGPTAELAVATSDVVNGKFSLALPATVADKYLETAFDEEDIPANVTVSGIDTKMGFLELELYEGEGGPDDAYVDDIVLAVSSVSGTSIFAAQARPTYSNSVLTVTGSMTEKIEGVTGTVSFNMYLMQGWNWMVQTVSISTTGASASSTTKLHGGMMWYLEDDLEY